MARPVPQIHAGLAMCSLLVLTAGGCGDDNASAPAPVDIAGSWQQVGGPCFATADGADIAEARVSLYLDFGDGQRAGRYLRDPESGFLDCLSAFYTFTTSGLLMFGAEPEHSTLLEVERPAEDMLVLTRADRQAAIFTRCSVLPDSMSCREITVLARYDLPIEIDVYDSGLAFDGRYLWFTDIDRTQLVAIDPDTGGLGPAREVRMTKAPVVHAGADADLWRLGAGSWGMTAYRIGPDESVRDVVTAAEIGHSLAIRYLACDAATGTLRVGQNSCGGQEFLTIDAAAEPDRLLESVYVRGIRLEAMACLGPRILAIGPGDPGQPNFVAEIDPVTWRAIATWGVFDPTIQVLAIATAGERVFLLGHEPELYRALILEVTL